MTTLRIAQLANFVGPVSGGMKVAIDALGKGYVAAGHERILVIPGPKDRITESESGITVEIAAPRVSAGYRMICLLYTSPSPRDGLLSRMPSSA